MLQCSLICNYYVQFQLPYLKQVSQYYIKIIKYIFELIQSPWGDQIQIDRDDHRLPWGVNCRLQAHLTCGVFGMTLYLPIQVSLRTKMYSVKEIYKQCPRATQKYPTSLNFPTSIPITFKNCEGYVFLYTKNPYLHCTESRSLQG